jgi:hypothetical protein
MIMPTYAHDVGAVHQCMDDRGQLLRYAQRAGRRRGAPTCLRRLTVSDSVSDEP